MRFVWPTSLVIDSHYTHSLLYLTHRIFFGQARKSVLYLNVNIVEISSLQGPSSLVIRSAGTPALTASPDTG